LLVYEDDGQINEKSGAARLYKFKFGSARGDRGIPNWIESIGIRSSGGHFPFLFTSIPHDASRPPERSSKAFSQRQRTDGFGGKNGGFPAKNCSVCLFHIILAYLLILRPQFKSTKGQGDLFSFSFHFQTIPDDPSSLSNHVSSETPTFATILRGRSRGFLSSP
jgi:hypothetical protein